MDELAYLEDPAIALVDLQVNNKTDAELEAMLSELNILVNQPGAQRRRMTDEATALRTSKPRVVRKKMDLL